jgi:hypothetical protein
MSSDRERIREAVRSFEAGEVYGREPLPLENQNSMGVNEVWVLPDDLTVDVEGWQIGVVYYRHCESLYSGSIIVGAVPTTYDKDWYTANEKVKIRSANSGAISLTHGPEPNPRTVPAQGNPDRAQGELPGLHRHADGAQ